MTSTEPMDISVYITSYNQKRYLVEAIESVLSQTLRPAQIVVVDDCSTDGSRELVSGYASRYPDLFTLVFHTSNQGIARTRNDGLLAATGSHVTHVDGDDRFLPTKLESEARLLQDNPDAQIAFSDYYYINAEGTRTGRWAEREKPPQGDVFCQVFARDFPNHSLFRNALIDREAWQSVGLYDPNLSIYEDYDMLIRLTKRLRVVYHDEPLSEYRLHQVGLSRASAAKHLAAADYIYEKNRPLLDGVSSASVRKVEGKLGEWRARIARRGVEEAIEDARQQGRGHALRKYLQIVRAHPTCSLHYKPILRILLPDAAYESLRAVSRRVRRGASWVRS
jgi:glycosyltransferase involved in cell wall biosynthesis